MALGQMSLALLAGVVLAATMTPGAQGEGSNGVGVRLGGSSRSGPDRSLEKSDSSAMCSMAGTSAHYAESLSGSGNLMERNVMSETGCPNHVNWAINPNTAMETQTDMIIPAYPRLMKEDVTDLSTSESAGAVGMLLNGVAVFSSWSSEDAVDYKTSALAIEGDTLDLCGGHSTATGIYHHHNAPGCLQEQAMVAAGTTAAEHTPQLGWSYDGFPIYGQLGPNGVQMKMCGAHGAHDTYCLDSCSGYEGTLEGVDDFTYRYYMSCGSDESYFPATTNCYRGCCPMGISCSDKVEACPASGVEDGFTAEYVPEAEEPLSEVYDTILLEGHDHEYIHAREALDCSLFIGAVAGQELFAAEWDGTAILQTTDDEPGDTMTTMTGTAPPKGPVPTPSPAEATAEDEDGAIIVSGTSRAVLLLVTLGVSAASMAWTL